MNVICIMTNVSTTFSFLLFFFLFYLTIFLQDYDRDTQVAARGWTFDICCHSALVFLEFR